MHRALQYFKTCTETVNYDTIIRHVVLTKNNIKHTEPNTTFTNFKFLEMGPLRLSKGGIYKTFPG